MGFGLMWMAIMLIAGGRWVRRDVAAFRQFEALSNSIDRQRTYRRWIVQSFVILTGASVITLWLTDGLAPFDGFPSAFEPMRRALQPTSAVPSRDPWLPVALGLAVGIAVSVGVQWRRMRTLLSPRPGLGDALLPRNRREGALVLLLSLNAGFSEELFFRLALPLLLFQSTHSLAIAWGTSVVCFGLAHAFYGWKGILATMAGGALLTLYYVSHGSLVRVMVAHALIDVIAFFVRPALVEWFAWRRSPPWIAAAR